MKTVLLEWCRKNRLITATLFAGLFALSVPARGDIYQWEWVNPADHSQGIQQSTTLAPGGAGVNAVPFANLANRNLTMAYLVGADLENASFNTSILVDTHFTDSNLTNVIFYRATLTGVDFTNTVIRGANFNSDSPFDFENQITEEQLYSTASYQNHDLTGISMRNIRLTNLNLAGQNLANAELSDARLAYASLIDANLMNASLLGTDLTGANLSNSNLTNASLRHATLTGANFSGAEVRRANFGIIFASDTGISKEQLYSTLSYQNFDLTGIRLVGNNLTSANFADQNFTTANLQDANLTSANLTDANFDDALLTNTNFYQATLTDTSFAGAEVRGASFRATTNSGFTKEQLYSTASYHNHDLSGVHFSDNILTNWDLMAQNLSNAQFGNATLNGVEFNGATIQGSSFFSTTDSGFTKEQLYSTASYLNHDLSNIDLGVNNLANWNFAGQNLSNSFFYNSTLTNVNLADTEVRGASFISTTDSGFTKEQLYSTASYQKHELMAIDLRNNNLANWNFGGQNLTNARFTGATITNADFTAADTRGAMNLNLATTSLKSNLIHPDGQIHGLSLGTGQTLVIRDFDGTTPFNAILVNDEFAMSSGGTAKLVLEVDTWNSRILFEPSIPVSLGGTLELTFASGVDVSTQLGRTIDLFEWTGVNPTGQFTVSSPYTWDLSKLYTTGEVTLLSIGALPGDYNDDGEVNAADYVVWRDRIRSLANYNHWRNNFGSGNSNGSGQITGEIATGVPEPTSIALFLLAATFGSQIYLKGSRS